MNDKVKVDEEPCAGTLPLNHNCCDNNDRHTRAEPCCTIDDGTLHGFKDMFLAGVTAVAC